MRFRPALALFAALALAVVGSARAEEPTAAPDAYGQKWNLQIVVASVLPKLVKGYLSEPSGMSFGL